MQTLIKSHAVRLVGALLLCASLAACGGGGSDGGAASANASSGPSNPTSSTSPGSSGTTTPSDTNHAPTISGTAITSIAAGQAYSFLPASADSDNDALQFTITSKPSWASFDTATGRLTGTPTNADVGTYEEIEISVTDGSANSSLPQFSIVVEAATPTTQNVVLSWQPPTTNTDGSTLTNLNGYRILYGVKSGVYTQTVTVNGAGITSYTIENMQSGAQYYIALVAVNSVGAESEKSQEIVVDLS
jgi:hypothetical protein